MHDTYPSLCPRAEPSCWPRHWNVSRGRSSPLRPAPWGAVEQPGWAEASVSGAAVARLGAVGGRLGPYEGPLDGDGDDQTSIAQLADGPANGVDGYAVLLREISFSRETCPRRQPSGSDLLGDVVHDLQIHVDVTRRVGSPLTLISHGCTLRRRVASHHVRVQPHASYCYLVRPKAKWSTTAHKDPGGLAGPRGMANAVQERRHARPYPPACPLAGPFLRPRHRNPPSGRPSSSSPRSAPRAPHSSPRRLPAPSSPPLPVLPPPPPRRHRVTAGPSLPRRP